MSDTPTQPPSAPTQAQIDALMRHIERIEKKRKIMLAGYLAALVLLVGGQIGAFVVYASTPPGTFVGWVFLVPFAAVGAVLWVFGKWAQSLPRIDEQNRRSK
jgi:hypothetical protein